MVIQFSGTLIRVTSMTANVSGLLVGLIMLGHGGIVEMALAISVITGHLASLLGGQGDHHDPNHVAVHKNIEGH